MIDAPSPVSTVMAGPRNPKVKDKRPDATDRVPDVAEKAEADAVAVCRVQGDGVSVFGLTSKKFDRCFIESYSDAKTHLLHLGTGGLRKKIIEALTVRVKEGLI